MIDRSFKNTFTAFSLLFGLAGAQAGSTDHNSPVDILSCNDLSCINLDSGTVCQSNATLETGVGVAPRVLSITGSGDPLSLTLADGYPLGVLAGSGAWLTTQTLYVGLPVNFNASGQNDACALMLQYQAQTLPEDEAQGQNTTSCDGALNNHIQEVLTIIIEGFDYSAYGDSNNIMSRCEALTQYFNAEIHSRQNIGPYLNTFLTATGGTLLGSNANATVASPQSEGCQPVSPQEYTLHQVAVMDQFLYRTGPLLSTGDAITGAGRTGVTPVLTVVYGDDEDSDPKVQYFCMKTFTPDGARLPQNSLSEDETSDAPRVLRGEFALAVAGVVGSVFLLQ